MSKDTIKNRVNRVVFDGDFSKFEYNITASAKIIDRIKKIIDLLEEEYPKEFKRSQNDQR